MPIITQTGLTGQLKSEIGALLANCRQDAPLTLTFPMEHSDLYLLYYDENSALLSAAAFTQSAKGEYECSAFTEPGFRNQGLFSSLLETALEILPDESDILFFSDGNCPDTEKTLEALEAEFLDKEYFMELSPENFSAAVLEGSNPSPALLAWESDTVNSVLTLSCRSDFGRISILSHQNSFYLFDLKIQEDFRGIGHGKALLYSVLTNLMKKNPQSVRLQVSGSNLPALNLYKKTGFHITETLSCYLY